MIKKITLICFLFSLIGYQAAAQRIQNGIVAGAVASQIDGDEMAGFNKAGIMFGGSSAFLFTDNFSIQPEILFMQKGARTTGNHEFYRKYRLNYIAIPVLAQYQFHPRFKAIAGLSADYLLSATFDGDAGKQDERDIYRDMDYNIIGGVEYKLNDNFGLNMRYQYSVRRIDMRGFYNNLVAISMRYYLGDTN